MKKPIHSFAIATPLIFSLFTLHAHADDDLQEIEAYSKQFNLISLEEAKAKALEAKSGVVKEAELESRKLSKGWDYEFEIVDADGVEWEVNVDAKTGKVGGIYRDWF